MGEDGYSMLDGELVGRAKDGDRGAFGQLVLRHQRRVFALGLRWFRNADDADDLVQETFVRAWRALDRFDETRPFAPWLITIAVNRAKTMAGRPVRRRSFTRVSCGAALRLRRTPSVRDWRAMCRTR
jgi:RNA polymerase sigma-70 factor (ECF subfamily)